MLKYKKIIEAIRLIGFLALGLYTAFSGNILVGLAVAIILGLIDLKFIRSRLKPKDNNKY
ncbi:hypothetical protein FHT67_001766 [Paenibacillus sp. BK720]|nr:hypothetical protein [Paenibacillus sp. BK720]